MSASWAKRRGRRAFLGGAGAAITLPFLPSVLERQARAAATKPPRRFVAWMLPNGVPIGSGLGNFWRPSGLGATFNLSDSLQPLSGGGADVSKDVLYVSSLSNLVTYEPGAHASGATSFLTCTKVAHTDDPAQLRNGISLDQLLAQRLAPDTRFPSLALDLAPGRGTGDCDFGLGCTYMFNISWKTPTTPAEKFVDPLSIFNRLFAGTDGTASLAEQNRRRKYRTSILDYALEDANSLRPRLGNDDRVKLDELLGSIRDLERQIMSTPPAAVTCPAPAAPPDNLPLEKRGPIMVSLQLLALQCDLTRFLTFKLGSGFMADDRDFRFLGLSETHHTYSHHFNQRDSLDMCIKVVRWEMGLLAELLRGMKAVTEADGSTLLDNSAVYVSSEVADPNDHTLTDFTALLAGRCQGAFRPGRHLEYRDAPVANLFLSILRAFDQPDTKFGDTGTAPLDGLS